MIDTQIVEAGAFAARLAAQAASLAKARAETALRARRGGCCLVGVGSVGLRHKSRHG